MLLFSLIGFGLFAWLFLWLRFSNHVVIEDDILAINHQIEEYVEEEYLQPKKEYIKPKLETENKPEITEIEIEEDTNPEDVQSLEDLFAEIYQDQKQEKPESINQDEVTKAVRIIYQEGLTLKDHPDRYLESLGFSSEVIKKALKLAGII